MISFKHISLFLITLLTSSGPWAADYYVNPSTGNDSNVGSSGSPFRRAPGDTAAAGTAAATNLSPGDTVYIDNTSTYVGTIRIRWNGSSGNRITYDGTTWGPGTPDVSRCLMDGNITVTQGFQDDGTARNWLRLYGFRIQRLGGIAENDPRWGTYNGSNALTASGGYAINFQSGGSDIEIEFVHMERVGVWQVDDQIRSLNDINGAGIILRNCNRLTMSRITAQKMHTPVKIHATTITSEILLSNFEFFTNITWGVDISANAASCVISNITVKDGLIHEYAQFDAGNWLGATGSNPHRDGIFLRSNSQATTRWYGLVVDGVEFRNDNHGNAAGGTACIYSSAGPPVTVVNCLFLDDKMGPGAIDISISKGTTVTPRYVRIYNNTFFTQSRSIYTGSNTDYGIIFDVRNNILVRRTSGQNITTLLLGSSNWASYITDFNRNLHWSFYSPIQNFYVANLGGSYYTFASWKTFGYDVNGLQADPLFVVSTGVPSQQNVSLQANSPAINAGENLTSVFTALGLDTNDQLGNPRPASGSWELGAREFTQTSTDIFVSGNGVNIPNGDTTPIISDGTSFGIVLTTNQVVTNTFSISNPGTTTLSLTGTPIVQKTGSTDFTVLTQPTSGSITISTPQTFKVTFSPSSDGLKSAVISIPHNGPTANPFTYTVSGTGYTPVVVDPPPPAESIVMGNSINIADGDTTPQTADGTSFGTILTSLQAVTNTFFISNPSETPLSLTGTPDITLTGSANFTIHTQPASSTVTTGTPQSFSVKFSPTTDGLKTAVISFTHNAVGSPFTFTVTGNGYTVPVVPDDEVVTGVSKLRNVNLRNVVIQ